MDILEHSRKRLSAFLEEIARQSDRDFPYDDSRLALDRIRVVFARKLERLDELRRRRHLLIERRASGEERKKLEDIIGEKCALTIIKMIQCLPRVGLIVRSTEVRNAFETVRPVLDLARSIVQENKTEIRLVLSSEWDYSPVLYEMSELEGFIFMGLPVPESDNPLLIPLAGHELGHFVWREKALKGPIADKIEEVIPKLIEETWPKYRGIFPWKPENYSDVKQVMFYDDHWASSTKWAVLQAEETFADCLALRVFGPSYLFAFAYIASPNTLAFRTPEYPDIEQRVAHLKQATKSYELEWPSAYEAMFRNSGLVKGISDWEKLLIQLADDTCHALVPELVSEARAIIDNAGLPPRSQDEEERIYKRFKLVVPAAKCQCLSDILSAAWRAYMDPNLWDNTVIPPLAEDRNQRLRDRILKDLVLKNIEVFEIEHAQEKSSCDSKS